MIRIVFSTLLLLSTSLAHSAPTTLGIFPYFDAGRLAALHQPLAEHFAKQTGLSIAMLSSPNFKSFKQRTKDGRYDIIVTAPHLGRTAEKHDGYQWLGLTSNVSHAVFAVRKGSNIKSFSDLKNTTITLPTSRAIIHHLALDTLVKNGLTPGKDVKIVIQKSHNNAMLAVIEGITPAAAFGRPTWDRYKPKGREEIKMLGTSEDIPGFAVMAHKRLGEAQISALRTAFLSFMDTAKGKEYFEQTGLKGSRSATTKDFDLLDKYLKQIREAK